MKLATTKDQSTIWNVFKQNRSIFPHIRTDYLKRQVIANNVVFEDGIIIVNNRYQRRVTLNKKVFEKDTYIIHQVVNSKKGNGIAENILTRFLTELKIGGVKKCILTVRKSNLRARQFYKKLGFRMVDTISWSKNRIKGIVYSISLTPKVMKGITVQMLRSYRNDTIDNSCMASADQFIDNLNRQLK